MQRPQSKGRNLSKTFLADPTISQSGELLGQVIERRVSFYKTDFFRTSTKPYVKTDLHSVGMRGIRVNRSTAV